MNLSNKYEQKRCNYTRMLHSLQDNIGFNQVFP